MKKKELDSDKKEELNSNSHERKVKEIISKLIFSSL